MTDLKSLPWWDDEDSPESEFEQEHAWVYEELEELCDFADPGGNSALRAATRHNPRNLPCPSCGEPNRLTPKDKKLGYQCDECADRAEGGGY